MSDELFVCDRCGNEVDELPDGEFCQPCIDEQEMLDDQEWDYNHA